ncbi:MULTISPECIES: hypothetical protein [unclassified Microcoleus]|uniref:hypothetical protein n=1 Tax=unclassified Microcoleus TaxID=2642155 RepID=UPI002FCF8A69
MDARTPKKRFLPNWDAPYLHRRVLKSFMFSLALAVGLIPQLLPATVSVNRARSAKKMAKKRAIVKRLPAIENFGSMNVFYTDKTGTLTEEDVKIHSAVDGSGKESKCSRRNRLGFKYTEDCRFMRYIQVKIDAPRDLP